MGIVWPLCVEYEASVSKIWVRAASLCVENLGSVSGNDLIYETKLQGLFSAEIQLCVFHALLNLIRR